MNTYEDCTGCLVQHKGGMWNATVVAPTCKYGNATPPSSLLSLSQPPCDRKELFQQSLWQQSQDRVHI